MAVADGGGSALDLLVSGGVLIALGQAGESTISKTHSVVARVTKLPPNLISFFLTSPTHHPMGPSPLSHQAYARSPR